MDESFETLINQAAEPVPNANLQLVLMKICVQIYAGELTQSDLDIFFSVFDSQWSLAKLSAAEKSGVTVDQLAFIDFLACLGAVVVRLTVAPSLGVTNSILDRWSRITRWLIVLESSCVTNMSSSVFGLKTRLICKDMIIAVLFACARNDPPPAILSALIDSEQLLSLVWRLWTQEIEDRRFFEESTVAAYPRVACVLDAFCETKMNEDHMIAAVGGNCDDIARIILSHAKLALSQKKVNFYHLNCTLRVATSFSFKFISRFALLSHGALTTVVNAMAEAVASRSMLTATTIRFCYHYVHLFTLTSDPVPFVAEIVDAHILSHLINGDRWLASSPSLWDDELEATPEEILSDIITPFLIYPSVLQAVEKYTKKAGKRAKPSSENTKEFRVAWDHFTDWIETLLQAKKAINEHNPARAYETCHMCGKPDVQGEFKRCKGCMVLIYCSPQCQKRDWKKHGQGCKDVQQLREEKRVTETPKRDWRFIKRFIIYHLSLLDGDEDVSRKFDACKNEYVEITLDFTEEPGVCYHFSDGDEPSCKCGELRREAAKARCDQTIRICAILPRGEHPEVLMLAIELEALRKASETYGMSSDEDFGKVVETIEHDGCCV